MLSPPPPDSSNKSMSETFQSIFSYNSNIMLAAIISLLLVILFVLVLHVYAKWFLAQAQAQAQARQRRRRTSVTHVLGPASARFHHFRTFNFEDSSISNSPTKGLDSKAISSIPLFIYEATAEKDDQEENELLECAICLSAFEDGEIGRNLPKCGHAFHVECIDMWLNSHWNCPICRASIVDRIVENENDSQLGLVNRDEPSALMEIVIDSPSSVINENEVNSDSVSETSSSLLRCSLKRMRSKGFPPSSATEFEA